MRSRVVPVWQADGVTGTVVAVQASELHTFRKLGMPEITLVEGIGVEGDAHSGVTVKHRSRVAANPSQPNLRQVHLIHSELLTELAAAGFAVAPGDLGENITTAGVELLALPVGTRLQVGTAVLTLTGLRNPCQQINNFRQGLLKQVLRTDDSGDVVRLAGVMAVVARGGRVAAGDSLRVELPVLPHFRLAPV